MIDTLVPGLITEDLELICVSLDFPNQSEIVKHQLLDTHHALVANPKHPLVDERDVESTLFQAYQWLVRKSDDVGTARISSFFAEIGLQPPRIAFETTSIHSILQGLQSGEQIACIPVDMVPLAQTMG